MPTIEPRERELARVRRAARLVERRMRLGRAVRVLPLALAGLLLVLAGLLVARQLGVDMLSEEAAVRVLLAGAAASILAVLAAAIAPLPPRAGALALDRAHALAGRLANAVAFSERPAGERTPLMEAAIDDACERAASLEFRVIAASPVGAPLSFVAVLALALPVALLALLQPPSPIAAPAPITPTPVRFALLAPDDADAFDGIALGLHGTAQSPEMHESISHFRALLRDLAKGRVDRAEAFRRLASIERALAPVPAGDERAVTAFRRTLDDLRDRIRQIGPAGERGTRRLRAFARRARGLGGGPDMDGASGDGDGDPSDDIDGPPSDPADSPDPGDLPEPPSVDSPQGVCSTPGTAPPPPVPAPEPSPISGPGRDDHPDLAPLGARTRHDAPALPARARARDSGQGPSRSRVILAAAQRGFRGAPYAEVYREYSAEVEERIGTDEIPPGFRFYVRRYFQLIRARD